MGKVLGIVYRGISTHLIHKAGFSRKDGATGAVTLIQRFGSALNLNIHFHILFLDGVYVYRGGEGDDPETGLPRPGHPHANRMGRQMVHVEPDGVGPIERSAEIEVWISHFTPGIVLT